MSRYTIQLEGEGRCCITHELSGVKILTDSPPEYGGGGRSFSSTDLVSAALGSCILTTIDKVIEREGYDPARIKIDVIKILSQKPKMIKKVQLDIHYPEKLDDKLIKKLERATESCPVKRSLSQDVEVCVQFITGS